MKRTFIAVDIPFNQKMTRCSDDLIQTLSSDKINWVLEKRLHLTLKFLGDTDEKLIPGIMEMITSLCRDLSPFSVSIKDIGVFKNLHNPRIIWFGIEKNNSLQMLHSEIDRKLEKFGFEKEHKSFSPHLTVGRIKELKNKQALKEKIEFYKGELFHSVNMDEVIFYESILRKEGSEYIVIEKAVIGR